MNELVKRVISAQQCLDVVFVERNDKHDGNSGEDAGILDDKMCDSGFSRFHVDEI